MELKINRNLCQGCEVCVHACPTGAIYADRGNIYIDQAKCTYCGACIQVCPTNALSISEAAPVEVLDPPRAIETIQPERVELSTPKQSHAAGGSVLSLVGQYVIPRVVDVFANYLERRLTPSVNQPSFPKASSMTTPRYGRRMRRRGRNKRFS